MMAAGKHIIQTMCFDTQTESEETAVAFAIKLRTINCEKLLLKILSKYDDILYKIKIDSLTVDVGYINLDDIDFLEEEITKQLEEIFDKKFSGIIDGKTNFLNYEASLSIDEQIHDLQIEKDAIETEISVLIHYLLNGSLPWNVTARPDIKALLFDIANKNVQKLKTFLLPHLKNEIVAKRLGIILSFDEIVELAKIISHKELFAVSEEIINILKEEINLLQQSSVEKELTAIFLLSLYKALSENKNFDEVFMQLVEHLLKIFPVSSLKNLLQKAQHSYFFVVSNYEKSVYTTFIKELEKRIVQLQHSFETIAEKSLLFNKQQSFVENKIEINKALELQNEDDGNEANESRQEYFYLSNAGLVLLNAALLQKYFEAFGWIKNKIITSETSIHKIILWMDFLVWGERKVYEYDLILNKVIAGIYPENLCDINIALSKNEQYATNEFLETIIKYWSILKRTSIEGLRTSFLQRNGRLSNEDGCWQLHVESKSFDLLIDSLPWSFSIIKFPWMQKPLFTQWQTKI